MATTEIEPPRYDFYQTATHIILSLYIKGYGTPELKDRVQITFQPTEVVILLPSVDGNEGGTTQKINLAPLYEPIVPEQTSSRVLSTKIELKLAKSTSNSWPRILSDDNASTAPGPSSLPPAPAAPASATPAQSKTRRNWDKVVDDELKDEEGEGKDPNGGGDAALQTFFSKLYADADEDTKRAMIKSYTESGGTSLSTNWSEIQKEQTPIRPPEGMEAKKY